jgi:predicted  nucleic acid-binding Zn-ribbon protein
MSEQVTQNPGVAAEAAESEQKPARTMADVQQEYQNLCAKAGQAQYQIAILSKDLEMLNDALRDLNVEAATIQMQQSQAAKKAAEEAAKPNEEVKPNAV